MATSYVWIKLFINADNRIKSGCINISACVLCAGDVKNYFGRIISQLRNSVEKASSRKVPEPFEFQRMRPRNQV